MDRREEERQRQYETRRHHIRIAHMIEEIHAGRTLVVGGHYAPDVARMLEANGAVEDGKQAEILEMRRLMRRGGRTKIR